MTADSSRSDPFEVAGDDTLVLRLHVQPGAGRSAVVGRHGDALKVRVAASPQHGRANAACLALLATTLGVDESALELTGGANSRFKRVRITGLAADDLRRLIEGAGTARPAAAPIGNVGAIRNVR
ncbi:MAG: DUF167 domain-containing protein [Acidimicrobiales bacterium]